MEADSVLKFTDAMDDESIKSIRGKKEITELLKNLETFRY